MRFILVALVGVSLLMNCRTRSSDKGKAPVIVDVSGTRMANPGIDGDSLAGTDDNLYDLTKPDKTWRLPDQLVEVSGNTWLDKDHLILIEDLNPVLYLINISGDKAQLEKNIPFANTEKDKYDIEDVTMINNTVYALYSHGSIFQIDDWQGASPQIEKFKTFLKKDNNSEGLCYDPVSKKLLVACKEDPGIKGADKFTRAVYSFDPSRAKLDDKPFMVIEEKMFKELGKKKLEFYPSAIAVHPSTHDIYILSTRDTKCLAVFSYDGKQLKSFQFIDKDLMPQPEGICFSPDGIMYISSEGKKGDPGNLFQFNPRD